MTTVAITAAGASWEYQFEDQNVGSGITGTRMLRYLSGPVVSSNAVYSALAAVMDDFQAMGFKNPMLPVTPNEYTMENKAFISRASTEKLKEGTIKGDWAIIGSAGNNSGRGVLRIPYTNTTPLVSGDIGRQVSQAVTLDTGTLLDFEIEPDGTLVMWVRPDDSTPVTGDLFDGTGAITVVGGTGVTAGSTAATSGLNTFTAIQAIGSVPVATEVYLIQDRIKLKDAVTNAFQFWATDPAVSLGIISVLIRTVNSGTLIAGGDLEVFARKYGSLYDNFRLNVSAGGFSALPLASSPDINNTTGYRTTGTLTGVTGTWTVGNGIYQGATWATATARGVITETNANAAVEYYLVGDLTDLSNTTACKEYDFVTAADGDATGTTATVGINLTGPTDTTSGEGGTVTITIGNTTADHDNSGTAEPYSVTIDALSLVPIAKVYERIKYVCSRGQDNTFWNTVASNIPGEQYRGLEATIFYDNLLSGPFGEGENITGQNTYTARAMAVRTGITGEGVTQLYLTVADQQTSVATVANNDTLTDGGASTVDVDTAGAGGAIITHSSPKASPFGTYTGSQIFGAPGILFTNPAAGDAQAYILKDDLSTLRTPPNTITFSVANTRAGDRIQVARDTGTSGVINKDQFGGMSITAASATAITVTGSIDSEVAAAGFIRVVETTKLEEHKYEYSSRTVGASGVFTLKAVTPGSATAGTTVILLIDSTADFVTDGVTAGMLIQNTTSGFTFEVVSVTNLTTLVIRQVFGTGGTFVSTNAYTINETIQAYTATDNIFDLIIDAEELVGTDGTPGSISNTLVKTPAANFGNVVQVRQGKNILPFEQNQSQGDGNTTVTTVRTPDTIAV